MSSLSPVACGGPGQVGLPVRQCLRGVHLIVPGVDHALLGLGHLGPPRRRPARRSPPAACSGHLVVGVRYALAGCGDVVPASATPRWASATAATASRTDSRRRRRTGRRSNACLAAPTWSLEGVVADFVSVASPPMASAVSSVETPSSPGLPRRPSIPERRRSVACAARRAGIAAAGLEQVEVVGRDDRVDVLVPFVVAGRDLLLNSLMLMPSRSNFSPLAKNRRVSTGIPVHGLAR